MNQEQVKKELLKLERDVEDFNVIFTGKKSRKVNGLYKPENRDILIHNKNFNNDNSLMYTAIHEFAHHVQFTTSAVPVSMRAHTSLFWDILHNLLHKAEKLNIYKNIFKTEPEFVVLTKKIRENYLSVNGELMLEFGRVLLQVQELCFKYQVNFDDYMDRELTLHRIAAKTIIKCSSMNINPKIGFENMKIVASIKDEEKARQGEEAFIQGQSPDMVKMQFKAKPRPKDRLEFLISEKERINFSIERLKVKLVKLEESIKKIKKR